MTVFTDIQNALDRIIGVGPPPNHGSFWQAIGRDEFVNLSVYGLKIVAIGDSKASNLVKALRGLAPFGSDLTPRPPGAFLPRMPKNRPAASEEDILLIEDWINNGCMDSSATNSLAAFEIKPEAKIGDDVHVKYWRAVDDFFLPVPTCMTSPETADHVNRMHFLAYQVWIQDVLDGTDSTNWMTYLTLPVNYQSFEYIRSHQRRILHKFYQNSQEAIFDSFWKFGADMLPSDPNSCARPKHTMNGVDDWFYWAPHLDATLRAADMSDLDLAMARAWQVGIIADGLLRTDPDRPQDQRMPITDFDSNDPNLRDNVFNAWAKADQSILQNKMQARARDLDNYRRTHQQ